MKIRFGIRARLFAYFVAAGLPSLVASGLLIEVQARRALESQMARYAESAATAIAASLPPEIARALVGQGGALGPAAQRFLWGRLDAVRRRMGVDRIAVWSSDHLIVADTQFETPPRGKAPRAPLLEHELQTAGHRGAGSTPTFRTTNGRLMKVGVASIFEPGGPAPTRPAGFVVVDVPAEELEAESRMARTLLGFVIVGVLLVAVAAAVVSASLERRLQVLIEAARRIEAGDLEVSVPVVGSDEVGRLAEQLDGMRQAIKLREQHLKAMLAGVAHEIRNPLGGLALFADLLADSEGLQERQREWVARIQEEVSHLGSVVEGFLAFARPQRPKKEDVAVSAVVEAAVEAVLAATRWEGSLETDLREQKWRCDPSHLREVLENLVRNAVEAAGPAGRVRVSVRREGIVVEDSGPGLEKGAGERIFEPFYTTKAKGAGLGLAIARRLCELNGIRIEAECSEDLGGALFRLSPPQPSR